MDSDQETEALAVLARMYFARALPFVFRSIRKDHFLDTCLHILFERKKAVGFHDFVDELRTCSALNAAPVRERLRLSLDPIADASRRAAAMFRQLGVGAAAAEAGRCAE